MKVYLDPGHGGKDPGAVANGIEEKRVNLAVALLARDMLRARGIEVLMSRVGDVAVSLPARTTEANKQRVDAFISIHHNAAGDAAVRGVEIYHSVLGGEGKRLGGLIHDGYKALIPELPSRGIRTRILSDGSGRDYYHVIRETAMPAIIIEGAFLTNAEDAALAKTQEFLGKQAQAIAEGVLEWYGLSIETEAGTPILGRPQASLEQARVWARARKASDDFIGVAEFYWDLAPSLSVRPEVAYAQSAKETAFGRFGGVITKDFNNWCGLKTSQGGGNNDPNAHARFSDDQTGVLAHIQHLALYAGQTVPGMVVDPRHFPSIRGTATTVEALGGKWAPNPDYGASIVRDYLVGLLATEVLAPPRESEPEPEDWKARALAAEEKIVRAREMLNDALSILA